jgi:signal transduction histidine kinase
MSSPAFSTGSIARRLFLTAAALSFPLLLVASVLLTQFYRGSEEETFRQKLKGYLDTIAGEIFKSAQEGREPAVQLLEPRFEPLASGWYWQVTRTDTQPNQILASHSLYTAKLPSLPAPKRSSEILAMRQGEAKGPDGSTLALVERRIDVEDAGVFLVQVGVSLEEIEPKIERFRFVLNGAFALLAIALGAAAAIQVRFGLRPLRILREELGEVRRGSKERIGGAYPQEVAPLVDELNLLIGANREIVDRARTQVGNLAHALKTPLSVIVNEADAAPSPLAEKVSAQATVMRDQISYYLDRARAAARAGAIGASTQIEPAVAALLRTFSKIYAERGIVFEGSAPEKLWFSGESQDLDEMVGNLLDNAGKWARSRVEIAVTLEADAKGPGRGLLLFTIDDDGPGLAAEQREAATQRGGRLDETKPGSGLGLSIVTDLAAAYGGSLRLTDSPHGGLRADLRLPGF